MDSWKPITEGEFSALFADQYGELNSKERELFDQYRVSPWKAVIRRSEEAGDEYVYIIAQTFNLVLYFDDVEYGFNWSEIDGTGRIIKPGGSQNSLQGAIIGRFPALR
jgi:hypothetical protein